jgi:hypothetical protein
MYPQVRELRLSNASTRAAFAVTTGPSGAGSDRDKGEAEQAHLDKALKDHQQVFTTWRLWAGPSTGPILRPQSPAPDHPGARRLGDRRRTGTRHSLRRRGGRRPGPPGTPRRAAGAPAGDLVHRSPPGRHRLCPVRRGHRQPARPDDHRPPGAHPGRAGPAPRPSRPAPASRPQDQDPAGLPPGRPRLATRAAPAAITVCQSLAA